MAEFPNADQNGIRSRRILTRAELDEYDRQLKAEEDSSWVSWKGAIYGGLAFFFAMVILLIIVSLLFDACGDSTKPRTQTFAGATKTN